MDRVKVTCAFSCILPRCKWAVLWAFVALLIFAPSLHVEFASAENARRAEKKNDDDRSESKKKVKDTKKRKKKENQDSETKEQLHTFEASGSKNSELDAVLVLDGSGSMERTDPNRLRDQGAKLFARFLGPSDRLAVIEFDRSAKLLLDFTEVTPLVQPNIDQAIESVTTKGRYTNLYSPLADALNLLQTKGRTTAEKCVILLSDGQMDPHPDSGTADELNQRLFHEILPQYQKNLIRLYTVAMSNEADEKGLAKIAQATGAMHWFSPDVSSIHLKFSDLFLTLKRPQIINMDGQKFEIDSRVEEATFYISRTDTSKEVTLVDPQRAQISAMRLPTNVKWYRGSLFDLITISSPLPGTWTVSGIDSFSGHATLITNLELQLSWPTKASFDQGEKIKFAARLVENNKVVKTPGIEKVTFYTFKFVDTASGETVYSGNLTDDGAGGDEQADDGVYTGTAVLSRSGELKAIVSANSQTFTRQQHQPFSVHESLLSLEVKEADSFVNKPERFFVVLSKQASSLSKLEVHLVAKNVHTGEENTVKFEKPTERENEYELDTSAIANGKYSITAEISGIDANKKAVSERSNVLDFEVSRERVLTPEEIDIKQRREEARWWGIVSLLLGALWISGFGVYIISRARSMGGAIAKRKPYKMAYELEELFSQLESKDLILIRKPEIWERELFERVQDQFKQTSPDQQLVEVNYKDFPAVSQAGIKR